MNLLNGWYENNAGKAASGGFCKDKLYILDGGFASHICQLVPDARQIDNDPLWASGLTWTDPKLVRQVHEDFLRAGATIITTNTYQCSPEMFRSHLTLDDPSVDPHRIFGHAVRCADEAIEAVYGCSRYCLVAGSIGPYGACLGDGSEYTGAYLEDKVDRDILKAWHLPRIKRLAIAGVDLFAAETIPSVVEALAILDVVAEFPGMHCWISFQCRDGERTARGEFFDGVVEQLFEHPASHRVLVAIGVNCTSPRFVKPLLEMANRVNCKEFWRGKNHVFQTVPYVVYPNSGETWDEKIKQFVGDPDESGILANIKDWIVAGANVIGGCCRVRPDMIAKIKEQVQRDLPLALEKRLEREAYHSQDSWKDTEMAFLKSKNDPSSRSKDGASHPLDFGPIYAVPGLISQEKAKAQLKACLEYMQIPTDFVDDQQSESEDQTPNVDVVSKSS